MTRILGIDYSTKAIHAVALPLDPTAVMHPGAYWHRAEIPKAEDKSQRCRAIRALTRDFYQHSVTTVWVEEPWGPHRNADRALLPLYGAILATVPAHIPATGIHTQDWRRALGLKPNGPKADMIAHADNAISLLRLEQRPHQLDEHFAEAFLIAIAGRKLTWGQ